MNEPIPWLTLIVGGYLGIVEMVVLGLAANEPTNLTRTAIIALLWPYFGCRNAIARIRKDVAELRQQRKPASLSETLRSPRELGLYK